MSKVTVTLDDKADVTAEDANILSVDLFALKKDGQDLQVTNQMTRQSEESVMINGDVNGASFEIIINKQTGVIDFTESLSGMEATFGLEIEGQNGTPE